MENYIRFMNLKNRKTALKLLLFCAILFVVLSFIAFSNTRFNGFADVYPASAYYEKIREVWNRICEILSKNDLHFINFFR